MLYQSKELRWFFKEENKYIRQWFDGLEKSLSESKKRSDYYLPLYGKPDVGIKLREGNIEIKERKTKSSLYQLTEGVSGYLEQWERWSFELKNKDELANKITRKDKFNWIEIQKERWAVKFTNGKNSGAPKILDIKEELNYGCQLEYTEIKVNSEEWFTLSFEWFGDEFLELDPTMLQQILGGTRLDAKDSMGYSEFLDKK